MSSEEHELRWYLMSTKRGEEALVSKALESVCAEVFLPLIHQRPGSEPEPVFLRHIFARVDWKKRRLALAYSADMRDDLTSRQPPVELPDALVMELKAAAAARHQLRAAAAALISRNYAHDARSKVAWHPLERLQCQKPPVSRIQTRSPVSRRPINVGARELVKIISKGCERQVSIANSNLSLLRKDS